MYTNTDVLHNKIDELQTYINKNEIEIITITETLPKDVTSEDCDHIFLIEGFNSYSNHNGRGVIIFVKNSIECTRLNVYEEIFSPSVILNIKVSSDENVIFGVVYRSPNCLDEDNDNLNKMLNTISEKHKAQKIVITGDFNFPDINWIDESCTKHENHKAFKFLECVQFNNLIQYVNKPTHHRAMQTPTLIDLILSNESELIQNIVFNPPLGKNHHSVVCFNLDIITSVTQCEPVKKFQINKGNYDKMREHMKAIDWDSKLDESHTLCQWMTTTVEIVDEAKELYIPKKSYNPNFKKKTFEAPITLLSALQMKRKAFKVFKKYPSTNNHNTYVFYRNLVNKEVRKAKRTKELKVAKESKLNPKALFQYIASKTKPQDKIPNLEKNDGTLTANDKEKVEVLSDFFKSVYTLEGTSEIPTFKTNTTKILSSINVTQDQVLLALQSLNVNKSSGPDGLHPRILKELAVELSYPIHKIFIRSLKEGLIPNMWREAEVRPIYKKGKKSSPGNYRPVSLTSILCKILEGFIRTALYDHLVSNNLLSVDQFGFCKGRSCLTQLLVTLDEWMSCLDENVPVDAAYLDFKKAFDSVPHKRLICKLKGYGIDGKLLSWIENFLSDRTQYVTINGISSDKVPVTSGVPQGSVLGPTLFIYYINDLPSKAITPIKIFADDAKNHKSIISCNDQTTLQKSINALVQWSKKWLLGFNTSKCNMMHLGKNNLEYAYTMCDGETLQKLNVTKCEKDLGVHIDPLLKFNEHITKTIKKGRSTSGMILRSISSRSKDILLPLYKALVRPILEYANPVWSPFLVKDVDSIERVQRQFTKRISGVRFHSYSDRLKKLNLPSLVYRRQRGDMIECYKLTHHIHDPLTTHTLFEFDNNNITRSHPYKLKKPRFNSKKYQHFFTNRIVNPWNGLPADVVSAETLNAFKNKLDKHWAHRKYLY